MAQYGRYTKWGALALFIIITLMGQKWGVGGAIASFLTLALFATLYAIDETAGLREAEVRKRKEEEERKKTEEEERKKSEKIKEQGGPTDRSGQVALKAALYDREAEEKKLFQAARDGDLDAANRLIESGTAVDAQNANGVSPLMFAVKFGHLKVAELLIEQGADVNLKSKSGVTAMKIAREAKNQQMIDLLSSGGALD